MTLKNVALVFGPTLMRSADGDMLMNMAATYSVVDLLCSHVSGCGLKGYSVGVAGKGVGVCDRKGYGVGVAWKYGCGQRVCDCGCGFICICLCL